MGTMSREEMIRMAQETRKQVTNAVVTDEEMQRYPVVMEEISIPTRVGESKTYYSYCEDGVNNDVLIVNFHGGGYIRARTPNDELFCRKLNHVYGCRIIDVDYRIAPDYPYPTAVHETFDVTQWIYENRERFHADPNKIIWMGHSAGGTLAIAAVMEANRIGGFVPASLIVEYPPLDLYTDPDEKEKRGGGVPAERVRLYNLYYCDREYQKDAYASPVYATDEQLVHFPETLIITAGLDDLCTEGEEFALHLARCGNEVTIKRVQGAGHAFTIYRKEKHEEAFALILKYLKRLF